MDILSVITNEELELPDKELGERLLDYWIAGVAEKNNLDPWNLPQQFIDAVSNQAIELEDGDCAAENDFILTAIRMAAKGKYEKAGQYFRDRFSREVVNSHARQAITNQGADARRGRKVIAGSRKAHAKVHGDAIEKANKSNSRFALLAKIRRENPGLSNRKIHEIAEAESESALGEKVSYKAFERLEKKTSRYSAWDTPATVPKINP